MENTCNFSRLPIEVMVMIAKLLREDEKIALKLGCSTFFFQHRSINIREAILYNKEDIGKMLLSHSNPDIITKLDFNFCYWMSAVDVSHFLKRCNHLEELRVAHTNLNLKDLADALHNNGSITRLSLSIQNSKDFWVAKPVGECFQQLQLESKEQCGHTGSWQTLLSMSHFAKCQKFLAQLHSLELYVEQDPVILGILLSGCENLENLCIALNQENQPLSLTDYLQMLGNNPLAKKSLNSLHNVHTWNHIKIPKLKSFVLSPIRGRTTGLDSRVEKLILNILENESFSLHCLWTANLSLATNDLNFNMKDMISWKENGGLGDLNLASMSAMQSLAYNKYMQRGEFHLPNLKQIECGFWKDNFPSFCREHPQLERLRLNKRPCEVSELYSIIDWTHLPSVKVMSLHSRIIYASDYLQNTWFRNRAYRSLYSLLWSCRTLEELEICPDYNESAESIARNSRDAFITADSLSQLLLSPSLRKFILVSVTISYKQEEINDPSFLEEIAMKCPNLEMMSVQDLSINLLRNGAMVRNEVVLDTLYNDCIERCCLALRSAHKLRFLRWKLRVVTSSYDQLIRLFAYYRSLTQLGLIATSVRVKPDMYAWDEATFSTFFVDLVQKLPKLIALLIVLPDAPLEHCMAATTAVESAFRPTRPCFCAQITNCLDSPNPPSLPWMHYQVLARDPNPTVGDLPFSEVQSRSRY